jgi:hypothetical protein
MTSSFKPTPETQLFEADGKSTRHGFNLFQDLQRSINETAATITSSTVVDDWFGYVLYVADGDLRLILNLGFAGTINKVTTRSVSGSCTATWKINTTALGGTANSVSTSEQEQAHATNNDFVVGDDIVLTVSSNSSCQGMSFSIEYTRALFA